MSLELALAALRQANRIDGTRASYRKDNPAEYQKVMEYLDGAPRPAGADEFTLMGQGLVWVEDVRRGAQPPPPPPPPTGLKLRDKPPGYPDYAGFARVDLAGRQYLRVTGDTLLNIGNVVQPEGIAIEFDKRLVILGGHITATGSNRAAGVGLALTPLTSSAHGYVEGLRIAPDKDSSGKYRAHLCDVIAIRGRAGGRVTVQNCLTGPHGTKEGFTWDQSHADVVQFQDDTRCYFRADRMTSLVDGTGIMCSEFTLPELNLSRWDFVYHDVSSDPLSRPHTCIGIYSNPTTIANTKLTDIWWEKISSVAFEGFPPELRPYANIGRRPEGSFVSEADVALPYSSPGYL